MPGKKIADKDQWKIDSNYICPQCKSMLLNPVQAQCGHFMCESCIEILLKYDQFG